MKLSLAWLFDHVQGSLTDYDVNELVEKITLTTAEVDAVTPITANTGDFTLARVTNTTNGNVIAYSGHLATDMSLPARSGIEKGDVYFLKKIKSEWRWATQEDMGSTKEGLLPAISCTQQEFEGGWHRQFEIEDYVIDIDNASITHRPDLWSHRGFAREVAAILGLPLKPADHFMAHKEIIAHEQYASPTPGNPFEIKIEASKRCKRFSAVSIGNIGQYGSWLWMLHRLCKVDAKPISGIVDATNYVLLDIGQPLHAFDAEKISTKQLMPRMAKQGQSLTLLDDQTIELSSEDLVISDGVKPIALAGIMGGKATAVTPQTRSIIVEAATFDAVTVRKSAQRHKLRTESSMRFEKSLDPHLNTKGLQRFLKLLEDEQVQLATASDIISLGITLPPIALRVPHATIECMLGVSIPSNEVVRILTSLEFTVDSDQEEERIVYIIGIPTFRATKDFEHVADVIEEIGRFYGYGNIPLELPAFMVRPTDITPVQRRRAVKYYIATNFNAREVKKYPIFDEQFLAQLAWEPHKAVTIQNPLSGNWRRLITSLVPHLLHCIQENKADAHQLRFFEWGRQWQQQDDAILERKMLAGIIYDQHKPIDFYTIKEKLTGMYRILGFDIKWEKIIPELAWYHPYQTAQLSYDHYGIGVMGVLHPGMLGKVAEGHAIVFELDGDFLLTSQPPAKRYVPVPPYQVSARDVSMFVPLKVTVSQLEQAIYNADPRIERVEVIDYYQRKEWEDKRSITLRFFARDPDKTLEGEDIDAIAASVEQQVSKLGATVR